MILGRQHRVDPTIVSGEHRLAGTLALPDRSCVVNLIGSECCYIVVIVGIRCGFVGFVFLEGFL